MFFNSHEAPSLLFAVHIREMYPFSFQIYSFMINFSIFSWDIIFVMFIQSDCKESADLSVIFVVVYFILFLTFSMFAYFIRDHFS